MGFLHGDHHLLPDFAFKNVFGIRDKTACINNIKVLSVPLRYTILPVARNAGCVLHNGFSFFEQAVEKCTFPDIFFMVDAATGITDLDMTMADILRRSDKPVFLVVNKVDNHDRYLEAQEFYQLGFEKVFFLSSISGSGTGELL